MKNPLVLEHSNKVRVGRKHESAKRDLEKEESKARLHEKLCRPAVVTHVLHDGKPYTYTSL